MGRVKIGVDDGAQGLSPASGSQDVALFGTCTLGTANTPVAITSSDQAQELLGYGPLAQAAALVADRGGSTVWCIPVAQSGNGSMGAWTKSGTGPDVGNTGTPNDAYQVWVKMTLGGAVATAKAKVSLDGGRTYGEEFVTAATVAVPNTGLTLTFAVGTYVIDDLYKSTAVPPAYTTTELNTAIEAWRASGQVAKILADIGTPASAAGGATIAGSLASKADTMEVAGDYVAVLLQAADDTLGNLTTAYAAVASKRELVGATFFRLYGADGRVMRRPVLWALLAETARRPISEDLGRVKTGPLPYVESIENDEESSPGFGAAKFVTLTKVKGRAGFYVASPVMRSPNGSDFDLLQMRRVMDVACDALRDGLTDFLNDTLPTQPPDPQRPAVGGTLDPAKADAIDNEIKVKVSNAVVTDGHATFTSVAVNRTDKIISTRKLRAKVRIGSNSWAKEIEATIGFAAPSLGG